MQPNNLPQYPGQVPVNQAQKPNFGTVPVEMPKEQKPIGLYVGIAVAVLVILALLIFGLWAFMSRQDYKTNSDAKAASAVASANAQQKKDLEAQFAEQEKSPLKSYTSPSSSGSVKIVYPKTWSAYISESATGTPVDGYFNLNFVPSINGKNNYYLRLQVLDTAYKSAVEAYNSPAKQGIVKISAFAPEQVKNATPGVRVDGQLDAQKKGSMVILPLRDKTLKIWTENEASAADFNNIVLKNLTYSP